MIHIQNVYLLKRSTAPSTENKFKIVVSLVYFPHNSHVFRGRQFSNLYHKQ